MREFSEFEKQLIKRIGDGKGNNLPNLIDPYLRNVSISINVETNETTALFEVADQQQIDTIVSRATEIEVTIIQAVNLIKLFEEKGYLFTYKRSKNIDDPFVYGTAAVNLGHITYSFPDERVNELLRKYSTQDIFITPELQVFINDGFIARDEKRFRRQFTLATRALIVALVSVFVNFCFNFKKEFFSDGQKIEQGQFDQIIETIGREQHNIISIPDSLRNSKTIKRDTIPLQVEIITEVTTSSKVTSKQSSR